MNELGSLQDSPDDPRPNYIDKARGDSPGFHCILASITIILR